MSTASNGLRRAVEEAVSLAEEFPQEFRLEILRYALEAGARGSRKSAPPTQGAVEVRDTPPSDGSIGIARIANELDIDSASVERAIDLENGEIRILGRINESVTSDLQRKVCAVYAFLAEKTRSGDVDIEELRTLCKDHGCYDPANFTANFRRGPAYLRELKSGGKDKRYRLTNLGLETARELLIAMARA